MEKQTRTESSFEKYQSLSNFLTKKRSRNQPKGRLWIRYSHYLDLPRSDRWFDNRVVCNLNRELCKLLIHF